MSESTPSGNAEPLDRRMMLGAGLLGAAALAGRASAGPISPPAGPVGPTGYSSSDLYGAIGSVSSAFAQAMPIDVLSLPQGSSAQYRITQPGNYYLSRSIENQGSIGIQVESSSVSIDLNGCTVDCLSGTAGVGILTTTTAKIGLTIRNGFVRGGLRGIDTALTTHVSIENVIVETDNSDNQGEGIRCSHFARVQRCHVNKAGAYGIKTGYSSIVSECIVNGIYGSSIIPGGAGIGVDKDCLIERCSIRDVTGGNGVVTQLNSVVRECVIQSCSSMGIKAAEQNLIERNALNNCTQGILIGNTSWCRENSVDYSYQYISFGIAADWNCLIEDNRLTRITQVFGVSGGSGSVYRRNVCIDYNFLYGNNINGNFIPTVTRAQLGTATNPHANIIE